ncbi:hypothetical protein, partial [Xanthomonas vasicola]|uniref:hypothetical protein n=1 Tax=Xanthomonas vasicola TaxID=56459 RepID=UPI001F2DBCF1
MIDFPSVRCSGAAWPCAVAHEGGPFPVSAQGFQMSPSRAAVLPKRLALQTTTLASALMFVLAATAVPAAAQQRSDGA